MHRLNPHDRSHKRIDSELHVYAWTPGGFLHAGTLSLEENGDRNMDASFVYDDAYLSSAAAYPLDPLNMPLRSGTLSTHSPYLTLGAIFDAAPDAWGRKVVLANVPPAEQQHVYRNAFLRGADGIGALLLTPTTQTDIDHIVNWSLSERPTLSQIDEAASAARKLEQDGSLPDELKFLLAGSWTIGGARPKALLRDDRPGAAHGMSLVAKFASSNDAVDRNRMEFVGLRLAAKMGLNVPHIELRSAGTGPNRQSALVIERFDRRARSAGQMPERLHYVSAMSFISRIPVSKMLDSRVDQAIFSWGKLLEVTSQVSAHPGAARVEMFARLALNTALQNTDDHLKNFGFLKSSSSPVHYEIAPVFDVSPQASDLHYLHHNTLGRRYNLEQVMADARAVGISKAAAAEVFDRILQAFSQRHEVFDEAELNDADKQRAEAWISAGLGAALAEKTTHRPPADDHRDQYPTHRG